MTSWINDNVDLVHAVGGGLIGLVVVALAAQRWYRNKVSYPLSKTYGEQRRRTLAAHMAAATEGARQLGGPVPAAVDPDAHGTTAADLYALRDDPAVSFREYWATMEDGAVLYVQRWEPRSEPVRGVCHLLHGYGDHASWMFATTIHSVCRAGYVVIAHDQRGHGQSDGLHGHFPRFDQFIEDSIAVLAPVRAEPALRDLPFFAYGESMGGAVALKLHFAQPEAWSGLVLMAPMCKIAEEVKPPAFVVSALSKLAPHLPELPLIPTEDLLTSVFRTVEAQQLALANPIYYDEKPRLATGLELLHTSDDIEARLAEVSCPFLLLHGSADVVTCPAVSQALYDQAASTDKTFRLYEGAWHALTWELPAQVDEMRGDVRAWLHERSAGRP